MDSLIDAKDVELALEAINIRNKVVHEGFEPYLSQRNHEALEALLRVAGRFISALPFKFPIVTTENKLFGEDQPGAVSDSSAA